jgi:maltose alpha-D-glucosyltransferase/alpha-amylase
MIRSFDYASHAALFRQVELGSLLEGQLDQLEPWRAFWHRWVSSAYARAYISEIKDADLFPAVGPELLLLVKVHLLEKAVREVAYEIRNRPSWARIPLTAVLHLLDTWSIDH